MNEALDELHEKAEMFIGAGDAIAAKQEELDRTKAKFETNTDLMYKYEQEKVEYKNRLDIAESRVIEL